MLGQSDDALKGKSYLLPIFCRRSMMSGMQAIFQIQPDNAEALTELFPLRPLHPEISSVHQASQSSSYSKPMPVASNSGMNSNSVLVPKMKTQLVSFTEAPWD